MRSLLTSGVALLGALSPASAQPVSPWVPVTTFSSGFYAYSDCLRLPTPTSAWCLFHSPLGMGASSVTIAASADNGVSWQSKFSGLTLIGYANPASGTDFTDLCALSAQEAWAIAKQLATNTNELQHTTTGPAGFAATAAQVPGQLAVRFFSATTGVVFSSGATASVYRTTNGGQSWQPVAGAPALTYNYATVSKCVVVWQDMWLVDAAGKLAHTADAGLTWITTTPPVLLAALAFRDGLHGLAYGPQLAQVPTRPLYRTADGGLTWALVAPTGPLRVGDMIALPGSPGTYISTNTSGDILYPSGTSISYDEGQSWAALDSAPVGALAADATGRVWSSSIFTSYSIRVRRLAATALATATAQPLGIELYPNPTTGVVQLPALPDYQQVAVYDLAGRQCRTSLLNRTGTTLDLSGLNAGSYLLRLEGRAAVPQQQRVTVAP